MFVYKKTRLGTTVRPAKQKTTPNKTKPNNTKQHDTTRHKTEKQKKKSRSDNLSTTRLSDIWSTSAILRKRQSTTGRPI